MPAIGSAFNAAQPSAHDGTPRPPTGDLGTEQIAEHPAMIPPRLLPLLHTLGGALSPREPNQSQQVMVMHLPPILWQ